MLVLAMYDRRTCRGSWGSSSRGRVGGPSQAFAGRTDGLRVVAVAMVTLHVYYEFRGAVHASDFPRLPCHTGLGSPDARPGHVLPVPTVALK